MEPAWTITPLIWPTNLLDQTQSKPVTVIPIPSPTETSTPQPSETPPPTSTPEPQWYLQGPDEVIVPILLYHHIGDSPGNSPYYVSPYAFEQQMYLLRAWGYETISVELMVRAIKEGALLPPKPIILTFDDGSVSVFTNALPIMQKYNFTGTVYLVHNFIGFTNYMNAEQIRSLYASGWEVGSHSLSHADLTERPDRQREEIIDSRRRLEAILGVPVLSFAYPFGAYNADSVQFARQAGYIAAAGLGNETLQRSRNLYYLYRMDVKGSYDLWQFASLLPWREDMNDLPALTLVP